MAKASHVRRGMGRFCSSKCYGVTRKRTPADFWARVDRQPDGCWLWVGPVDIGGYGQMMMDGKEYQAHRLAWSLTNGPLAEGQQLNHRCDVARCVRPDHLTIGSQAENMREAMERGRHVGTQPERLAALPKARGEDHAHAKLTAEAVREMRRRHATGETITALGAAFTINITTVSRIVRRLAWAHVD